MKTFYWSFVLMLLPSMAYTQTTEKENEFSMSMQIRPRAEYRNSMSEYGDKIRRLTRMVALS